MISNYIERLGGSEAQLSRLAILILLHLDDIVLISDFSDGVQTHENALKSFYTQKDLSVNLHKNEVMMFDTTQAWVTRSEPEFF